MIINQNDLQFDAYDDVLIKWKSDNQEYYLNPFEGCFYDKNNDYLKINKREIVEVNELNKIYTKNAISFKYDKKLEMLAIFTLEIKYYRPENNSPYKIKWEEIDRVYVDFDKNWWIAINKEENREYKNIGFCKKNKLPFNYELLNVGDWLIEIYNCFGSVVCIKDNFFYDIENIDDFIYFITKKEPTKSKSKKQKELDLLVQKDNKKINFEEYYFQFGDIVSIAYKVEEDISCIRCFCADYNYQKIVEGCRIYITKDNFYVGYKKTNGDIVYLSKDLTCENLALPLILLDYDFCENTLLKYNFENIILTDPTKRLNAIMAFLKWDIFEKLYKAGYINICKYCFDLEGETALSSLEMVFRRYGKKYEKGISIKEFTGLNTYQLKELNILFKKYLKTKKVIDPIKYLQSWFGANLFSIDNTTFKRALNCIEFALEAEIEEMFCSLISYIIDLKSFKYVCKHFDEICNIVENNKDSCSKIWWRKYRDYVRAISHPKMREYNCPLLFKNKEELQKEHEKISKTYCMIISKNNDEIFIEKEKIWEDKFYYKNEKFSIVGPKCILDIVNEGNKLKHCVKDYIEDIILGRKIILFLRKNDDLETPYFTIEITKNIVTQIHGLKNCNLPINSEEIQFIEKWMEFKEIQKGDYNLLR